jgi:hypothetical protein
MFHLVSGLGPTGILAVRARVVAAVLDLALRQAEALLLGTEPDTHLHAQALVEQRDLLLGRTQVAQRLTGFRLLAPQLLLRPGGTRVRGLVLAPLGRVARGGRRGGGGVHSRSLLLTSFQLVIQG